MSGFGKLSKKEESTNSVEHYGYISQLFVSDKISRLEAQICCYVFCIKNVLNDPEKYSTKDYQVKWRDLECVESSLIDSIIGKNINFGSLKVCREEYTRVFV